MGRPPIFAIAINVIEKNRNHIRNLVTNRTCEWTLSQ